MDIVGNLKINNIKKVLTLTVNKEWFFLILSGEKTEEYRVIKPYWASRLVNQQAESGEVLFDEFGGYCRVIGKLEYKPYTYVRFFNGYAKTVRGLRRRLRVSVSASLRKAYVPTNGLILSFLSLNLSDMKVKNIPKKIYLNICSNEDEVDYNELEGVTFSTEKVGATDCDTENVTYVNAASLWHDLKEEKPTLRKWVMFRYNGGGVKPTSLHHGAMSDDGWIVTRGDGTHRIEALFECYDKIEWLDFDELK